MPPAEKGEYEYVALVVTPNEVSLREWRGDEVTLLDSAEVESEKDVWYDLVIEWEEETLTVSRGLRGGEKEEILSAETTLESESTKVGFGLGAKADYLFDDVRFVAPSLSGGQSTMGRQYAYDAFGRRVAETYYVDGLSQTRYYVYDGDRVVEELDGDGNMTAGYVFGPYVDEVLAMRRDVDPESPGLETFYYLHDDQFNVIALTDAAGNVVERYEYGDFGDPTIYDAAGVEREDKTSAFGNVYMFQGRPYGAETGLYYFRTRYLDPIQGRFISRDSIGVWGDANNLGNPYTFVGNSPWTHTDPHGEAIETVWDAANVGLGVASFASNVRDGNWGWAALDALGVVADTAATAVPFIPGGAGAAIKATRVIGAVDTGVNVAVSTAGAIEAASSGDLKATALNVAGAALGAKSVGGAKAASGRSTGQLADAGDTVGGMRWIPGGGCLCFTEETLVHAEEGPKTIGEIEIGDYVWSLNEETGETELAVVTGKYKRVTPLVWQIEIAGRVVQTTEEHPFYVEGEGWTEAQHLEFGDPVRTLDGGTQAITAIHVVAQPTTVYNFSVNGNHNYYVSEDGLLVHNIECKWSPSHYPNPDPSMSAKAVRYEPETVGEVIRMRQGLGPRTKATHGTKNIEAHHRQQVPIAKGGVMDELEMDTHRGVGNHSRHNLPSSLSPAQRASEIREHWKRRGAEYILPGGEGI